jgi:peptidyl-prolyl cis-trans isomerase-like 4
MAVLLETSLGDITIDLLVDECPKACKNFLKLCKIKYYNNVIFHKVQKDLVCETGDPTGTGRGGESIFGQLFGAQANYFKDEIHPSITHSKFGTVSMSNMGQPNTNASQFFITTANTPIPYLDGKYTIFGEVSEGLEVLQDINKAYCDKNDRPLRNIRIRHTIVLDDPFDDPPGLVEPEKSPEPQRDALDVEFLADEALEKTDNRTEEEIDAALRAAEAEANATVLTMIGDLPDIDVAPPDNVLFVCKLNPVTRDEDLELIFSRFGTIKSCDIIKDWKTGDSLQYAFIEFETPEQCVAAFRKMDNVLIDERRIHVDFSQSVATLWNKFNRGDKDLGQGSSGKPGLVLNKKFLDRPKDDKYSMVFEQPGDSVPAPRKRERGRDRDRDRSRRGREDRDRGRDRDRDRDRDRGGHKKRRRSRS